MLEFRCRRMVFWCKKEMWSSVKKVFCRGCNTLCLMKQSLALIAKVEKVWCLGFGRCGLATHNLYRRESFGVGDGHS